MGHLRYKATEKGGSRSAKIKTDCNSGDKTPKSSFFGRRNWSDRFFYLDLDKGHWSYYKDAGYENLAGVVRLLPHSSIVVPEEVRLRGRHAPTDPTETLNYFEVHHTTDVAGKVRSAPFVVRAPSPREFEDWLRALRWCLARLRRGSVSEEPAAGGVSRDFYPSGGSAASSAAAGVTPETHTASTTTPPKTGGELQGRAREAQDNVRLSGQSERKSEERPASTELRLGFDAPPFWTWSYYQDMNGAQKGPVNFEGLKAVWTRSEIDELSYPYE